ncbi:MAG: Methionine gamma-lyase [uncultured Rubrobacteraceae bacterium]|uniref:homocysteine desulfhydrase n=1 Tax=uncultured Rubrobacteraceae bacterium TaxID=349277 RepID=A0A6J4QWF6_9ACTN|nr:MAG: Methionine gamma-lyase [uncultured Rubrobacteraceae bacterium]
MKRFETRAVHAGEQRWASRNGKQGESFCPMSTPVHLSTTFAHENIEQTDRVLGGEEPGYSYARYGNPTVTAFEDAMAALEGGGRAFAFASGMSAMHAALMAAEVGSGATVLAAEQLYGSTATLLVQIFGASGAETRFVDACDLEAVEKKVKELKPRAVVIETISNPLLRVADVPRIAEITRAAGSTLIVDATFGTPYLQRPLELGADVVVHSATKYLSGHGDLTAGLVVADAPYDAALDQIRKLVGGVMGPFEAWLALRGLKTLPLRMGRQCENAREISSRLAAHPKVGQVYYPGAKDHPDYEISRRVLAGAGGLVSFELAVEDPEKGRETAFRFLNALKICTRAPSLGDIYTLAIHPASASHRELSPSRRERLGVKENLIRVSCGIEHPEDVIEDIEQALKKA